MIGEMVPQPLRQQQKQDENCRLKGGARQQQGLGAQEHSDPQTTAPADLEMTRKMAVTEVEAALSAGRLVATAMKAPGVALLLLLRPPPVGADGSDQTCPLESQ